uniref:Uncharacterized protein n=1 Tax=Anopheles dirus TaxID=7168 RepID=A0A182N379_9DIPT
MNFSQSSPLIDALAASSLLSLRRFLLFVLCCGGRNSTVSPLQLQLRTSGSGPLSSQKRRRLRTELVEKYWLRLSHHPDALGEASDDSFAP